MTNLIPTFGPFIGAIPSTLILLMDDPAAALWFVVFTIILQQMDGNVIKPLLFGDTTGVAPVWVLVSIVVFGKMFGLLGMLLGVPVFAILKLLFDEFVARRLAAKHLEDFAPDERADKKPSWLSKLFGRGRDMVSSGLKSVKQKRGEPEDDGKKK